MKHQNVIVSSKEVLNGTPVFKGTRVPFQSFIDYLEAGSSLDDFLNDFPTVTREQALDVLKFAKKLLLTSVHETVS